jgi:hypothetical protein
VLLVAKMFHRQRPVKDLVHACAVQDMIGGLTRPVSSQQLPTGLDVRGDGRRQLRELRFVEV